MKPAAGKCPAIDRPLDPDLTRTFRQTLIEADLIEGRLALAVSGGPDSLALLLLANAAVPGQIEAATVDHGLRGESATEAAMVASVCNELDVPHRVLPIAVSGGNVQSAARKARYAALALWMQDRALDTLMTAHHADDQAETFMMRLNRGSGLAGLAGIRQSSRVPGTDLPLYRPLLTWRKADLESLVQATGLTAVQDPSNEDDQYDRARIRKEMAGAAWLDVSAIARTAGHLADAEEAIATLACGEWTNRVRRVGLNYIYRPAGPKIVRLRVVVRLLAAMSEKKVRGGEAAILLQRLERGDNANLAGVLARPIGDAWRFEPEPARGAGQA